VTGHVIVVDLGYGDAGKGTIVDWLCAHGTQGARGRPVRAVVRFNGGAQAAHHVLAPGGPRGVGKHGVGKHGVGKHGGEPHAFAQFGSGTFTPGTRTFLSRFMLVDPLALVAEAEHLASLGVPDPLGLVAVDRDALLTTPYHRAVNQAREAARDHERHGSCGMGIGETASYALRYPQDAPRVADMTSPRALERKLTLVRDRLTSELAGLPGMPELASLPEFRAVIKDLPAAAEVAAVYRTVAGRVTLAGDGYLAGLLKAGPVVFEGAQGVLLDEWRGFHPYTTWSTTTFENAETLLREAGQPGAATRLGVTRTYQTRHGPGPFPTEDPALAIPEPHNANGRWQGPFRLGHLDALALRYAAEVAGGVDEVALTHLDSAAAREGELRICRGYDLPGRRAHRIEPGPPRDLAFQEALARTLLTARPVYDPAERVTAADWPDAVAEILRAPVSVVSRSPSAAGKTRRPRQAASR
jgi:adenylosuccinate synthase